MSFMRNFVIVFSLPLFMIACSQPAQQVEEQTATTTADAPQSAVQDPRQVHERLITMDTHLDTPALLVQPGFDITHLHDPLSDYSQVDLPRMIEGGLDGGYWVIYTRQGELSEAAYANVLEVALQRSAAIRDMVATNPDDFELALVAEDAARIAAAGKRIVYQSIENAYPLGEDLSNLERFFDLGVRMVGPVHFANNQFADSATDPEGPTWQGLSPLGKELVAEANRLGMILDGSHAHDLVFDQLLELSATPIILSHSGAKAVFDHPRNIDDGRLQQLAAKGGVIQMNALGAYLTSLPANPDRQAAMGALFAEMNAADEMDEAQRADFLQRRRDIDAQYPPALATFEDYMEHFLHVLNLIGPEHVGVGADWDGGGGVAGMRDIAAFPRITERLLAEGYTEADLAKIWGGNVTRLLAAAEAYAAGQ